MSDDLFIQKADILFRKYGVQDVSPLKPSRAGDGGFGMDFLQEVQNAALEIARARRAETEQRIEDLGGLIADARARNDMVSVVRLEQEKNALRDRLPLD